MSELAILFGRGMGAHSEDRFELEALAAEELDIEAHAIPLDPIVEGDAEAALARLPKPRGRRWLYRGWMLNEDEYASLEEAIADRGEEMVVDRESFAEATYAPNYLPLLGARSADARWTEGEDAREAWRVACELGPPPWIVKDHVKSAKEEWHRACFVPAGADYEDFAAVCDRLLTLRGDRFERGFVVKKWLELAVLPGFVDEGVPVTDEHRLFFWEGELIAHAPYHDVDSELAHPAQFAFLGRALKSPFFAADVARLASGGYTVVEINDGGSAILPEQMDPRDLYRVMSR